MGSRFIAALIVTVTGIIGEPAWSDVQYAEVDTPAVRIRVAVDVPPVP